MDGLEKQLFDLGVASPLCARATMPLDPTWANVLPTNALFVGLFAAPLKQISFMQWRPICYA